jgi:sugar phosphate isomerase/epimerase
MAHRLACADFTFPLLSHDKSLDLISLLEFEGVDIGLFEGRSHLWPSKEFKNVAQSARQLKQKVADRGMQVADVFLQPSNDFAEYAVNQPDPKRRKKTRDWFLKTLEYATECECKHVTILPGVEFPDDPKGASLQRTQEELAWRVEQAKARDIVLGVEAHIGSIVPKPKLAAQLVESVPGLTLTLDYTHFTRVGLSDDQIEPLLKYASHFHVRGARKGRLQAPFKDNTIDYARVLKTMNSVGYPGYIGIEYVWIDWEHCNEVDNVAETVLFRDFFRKLEKKPRK